MLSQNDARRSGFSRIGEKYPKEAGVYLLWDGTNEKCLEVTYSKQTKSFHLDNFGVSFLRCNLGNWVWWKRTENE